MLFIVNLFNMEFRRHIEEYYRKIKDRFKGSLKKTKQCNWPELNKYYGCCNLSTGIYIRSVITAIITIVTIVINSTILSYLLEIGAVIYNTNLTLIDDYIATSRDEPERDLETLHFIYRALVIYYVLWISFKVIYILTVIWTMYALFKQNTKMLKILLYINIPNWILDFFISLIGSMLLKYEMKVMLVICILSEGYNILAINSEYKKITGKSRLVDRELESEPRSVPIYPTSNIENPAHMELRYRNVYSQPHCRSCRCFNNNAADNSSGNADERVSDETQIPRIEEINETVDDLAPPSYTDVNNDRELHIITVTPNQNQIYGTSSLNDIPSNSNADRGGSLNDPCRAIRPNTLNIVSVVSDEEIEEKVDIADIPIIYDERQLNIGTSPVIEDR